MTITEDRAAGNEESLPAPPRDRPRPRGRRWLTGAVVFLVAVAAIGVMAGNEVQANTRFDQARRSLESVDARTSAVDSRLAAARADLATLDGQVSADSAVLAADTTTLDGALVALAESRQDVTSQSAVIGSLQACLGGVEKALNALSLADQKDAVAALQAVATACTVAVSAGA